MTNPSNASKNLLLARWALPNYTWKEAPHDEAVNEYGEFFYIEQRRAQLYIIIKLQREHGIKIHERTRSGKTIWEAVSHGENMRGSQEHSDLGVLLVQIIEGLQNG